MNGDEELTPSERARARRRDRDAAAAERAGMRTGLAKQFKQVLDTQRRRGEAADAELTRRRTEEADRAKQSKKRP